MSEQKYVRCDRCGRSGSADSVLMPQPEGWTTLNYAVSGDLCPDCSAVLRDWIARRAELDEKDPTVLLEATDGR